MDGVRRNVSVHREKFGILQLTCDMNYTKYDILCHSLFGVTHSYIFFIFNAIFYQVKMLMFYNVQTTDSTSIGRK